MTREEKKMILDAAIDRAYERVVNTTGAEMCSENFQRLLHSIDFMQFMHDVQFHEDNYSQKAEQDFGDAVTGEPSSGEPEPNTTSVAKPEPEPEKLTEPVDNDENEEDEAPKLKMEEVRAALAKARTQGVNVSEIIRSLGAENFQQIKPDQYPTIMAKLKEA